MGLHGFDVGAAPEEIAPRSIGAATLTTKRVDGGSGIDRFRTSGSAKIAFPRQSDHVEAITINTSGGLTGGDRFDVEARAGVGSSLVMTTQSAERLYRRKSGVAQVRTQLSVEAEASLSWLPQEMIFYDGGALDRALTLDVAPGAEALVSESVLFGREAMGEVIHGAEFRDTVTINRDGAPLWIDRINLRGAIAERLSRPAVAAGARAMASVVYVGPRAETLCEQVRPILPASAGASMPRDGILALRLLARDGFRLRQTLVPVLQAIARTELPRSWSL
jgi:urease accessory protein